MPKGYKEQVWYGKAIDVIEPHGCACLMCGANRYVSTVRFKRTIINESITQFAICASCRRAIMSDLAETICIDSEI